MTRLVLEIGTEAIPAGYVPPALAALKEKATRDLAELRLGAETVRVRGTAKRLVISVHGLAARQEDRVREVLGPRTDVAFKNGKPTPAALGFARKNGVDVHTLERRASDKGEFLLAKVHEKGRPAAEVLSEYLPGLVDGIPWPKTMVWNSSRFRFPRPIRWVVCLLDGMVLPLRLGGIEAGNQTRGHWLLGPGKKDLARASDLDDVLAGAGVILDPERRRERINTGLEAEAKRLGGRCVTDPGLLNEVVFLVEQPCVLSGGFDSEFLSLPREVVVTAMRSHQRYFALESESGELLPHFLVVCDGKWEDPSQVTAGNERVLRARLADAKFYWDMDLRSGLETLAGSLGKMVWLESAGTLEQKAERVADLVERLGSRWFAGKWARLGPDVSRASRLAKADLASEMIKDGKEFTGLQGVIGARYAEAAGESRTVVETLMEQYLPRGAKDPLPDSEGGTVLAFADRLDTVVGCWGAGFIPSGSQDPYALRRAANGMVRILLEKELHLSLDEFVEMAIEALPEGIQKPDLKMEILEFLRDRVAYFLREGGVSYDVVDSVLAADADDPLDARVRAKALQAIRGEEALERLVVGFKRAANILKGIDESGLPDPGCIDWPKTEKAERDLHERVVAVRKALDKAGKKKDYPVMLKELLSLRAPIDTFFDDVMVMTEDMDLQRRRLALLAEVRELFHHLFDPARIVIEGE